MEALSTVENIDFSNYHPDFLKVYQAIRKGEPSPEIPVRTLLGWFFAQRRGFYVVKHIRSQLRKLGLMTAPDFDAVWIGSSIKLVRIESGLSPIHASAYIIEAGEITQSTSEIVTEAQPVAFVGGALDDPTYRIVKLDAANKAVVHVTPNHTIEAAVTLMLANGFSQLPVMQSETVLKGVISWETIGAHLALKQPVKEVRECMAPAHVIDSDQSLLAAIEVIARHQYVLVRTKDQKISGIVTSTDLSRQFQHLTEPFLLLGEVEQHIRRLIDGKFTLEELRGAKNPSDAGREITSVADLNMGEYLRLLENDTNWQKLKLGIDRKIFLDVLQPIRRIRNEVMHFNPEPLEVEDLQKLRDFVAFMQSLRNIGVIA